MAVNKRLLSVSGVEEVLNAGKSAYDRLVQGKGQVEVMTAVLEHIQNLIELAEQNEKNLCEKLGKKSIEELVGEITKFMNQPSAKSFTGVDLDKEFVAEFAKIAKTLKGKEDWEIAKLGQLIVSQIESHKDIVAKEMGEYSQEAFKKYFHQAITVKGVLTSRGTITDFRSRTIKPVIEFQEQGMRFMMEEITPTIRRRLYTIIENVKEKGLSQYPMLEKIYLETGSISKNTITYDFKSEWFNLTRGMTTTEIQKNLEENPQLWKPVRDKANQTIVRKILSKVSGSPEEPYFRKALGDMIRKNPNMFFVGRAANEITGLLGEMTTYAALHKIFGNKIDMKWVAQHKVNGKQLSIDFILEQMGIQVKNTTQDIAALKAAGLGLEIGFVSKSATAVMNTLIGGNGAKDLATAYESSYFNVSYLINHGAHPPNIVYKGSNSVFDGIESELLSLRTNIEQFLLFYSPQLLYMANDKSFSKQLATLDKELGSMKGNTLYIVGNQPIYMSQILKRIEAQVDNILKMLKGQFSLSSREPDFLTISANGETIIDYLNRQSKDGKYVGLEKQGFLFNRSFHPRGTDGLRTIQLTSSGNFF